MIRTYSKLLLLLASASCTAAASYSWILSPEHSLELRHNDVETLARFQIDPEAADPHFDRLKTIGGQDLVWVGPEDHPWHYGQWFS